MIRYYDVTKKYGEMVAVNRVTMSISGGEITALVGPNGSGKTTLMKMTLGLVKPTNGRIEVDGLDPIENSIEVRRITGYSPEEIIIYESLTPPEIFSFLGDVYDISRDDLESRVELYTRLFKLDDYMTKLCGELSHGNRRKVSIISALLHNPRILILDEPFSGLDPESGRILKEIMRKYSSEGKTIIFSTHILEIAEAVADRIAIIHHGKLAAEGSPEELRNSIKASDLESVFMKVTGLSDEVDQLIKSLWGS